MHNGAEDHSIHTLRAADVEYFYQPVFCVETGKIEKAETLLRVSDGAGGYLDTERIVTVAETMGLIDEWDRLAFISTCQALPRFLAHGIRQLSVNLSPAACHNKALVRAVRRILDETHTNPAHICIEITEVATLIDAAPFHRAVRALYDMGVHIAIDDFGKGYSNLQRMLDIPFHSLKLDKSLIWSMEGNDLATSLVHNMIQFARQHQISVVAEGIETADQACALVAMGCHYLQGYYFGKPVDESQFLANLDDQAHCGVAKGVVTQSRWPSAPAELSAGEEAFLRSYPWRGTK